MRKKWTEKEIDFLIENVKKITLNEIAEKLEKKISVVKSKLYKLGICTIKWSKDEDDLLRENFPLKPTRLLIELFKNRTRSSLLNRATFLGLKRNNEARFVYKKYKYNVNHNFFDDFSLENCYWAGFISADGCVKPINSLLSIKLSSKDVEHLEVFKKTINSNAPIFIRDNNSFGTEHKSATIDIYSKNIINKLKINFLITNKKTFTAVPPTIKNSNQKIAFIIGLLDGDGSIYKINNNLRITFLGTLKMLEWIKETLKTTLFVDVNQKIHQKGKIYSFAISNKPVLSLIEWVKKNEIYYLNRKIGKYV